MTYATDSDVLNVGIHWDGSSIKFYHAQAASGTEPGAMTLVKTVNSNIPDDSSLRPIIFAEATGGAMTVTVNYLRAAWEV